MSVITNIKKRGLKDILNPVRWRIFTRFLLRKVKGLHLQDHEIQPFVEQVIWRQALCKPCLLAGECTHCGCKAPELFYDKDMVCSGGNWNEMMSPEEWKQYKSGVGGLSFNFKYGE